VRRFKVDFESNPCRMLSANRVGSYPWRLSVASCFGDAVIWLVAVLMLRPRDISVACECSTSMCCYGCDLLGKSPHWYIGHYWWCRRRTIWL